ncbi:hypothetical protein BDV96DRAFT_603816 [Lophiotrema nucula]|uniref:Uncharacterized protein n=1 Tax=Lophiotrema nucula TaxID=690887 RepID=A0A6A5YVF3_9PLEO|nr:hypothetical protein BDV96DRAFT_603816 [Lophiotrema nucula]
MRFNGLLYLVAALWASAAAAIGVQGPGGKWNYVAMGLNKRGRIVFSVVQVVTTNSAIFNALGSEPSVASAIGQDLAARVQSSAGWPSATYSFWGESTNGVFAVVTKMVWNGGTDPDSSYYDYMWGILKSKLATPFGLQPFDNFVVDTGVIVSKRGSETDGETLIVRNAGVCPGAHANYDFSGGADKGISFGASCDKSGAGYCFITGDC